MLIVPHHENAISSFEEIKTTLNI